jgi:hypothetical protein
MHHERARRWHATIASGISEPLPPLTPMTRETSAAIAVTPTLYPAEPEGTVIVENHITINVQSADLRELNAKLDELLSHLRRSNEISGDVRDQLIAEIRAGKALLTAPKPNATLIELLLKRPLTFIAKQVAGTVIGRIAGAALELLGKLTGLW